MATILLLVAPGDERYRPYHFIYTLGEHWARAGHRFIVHAGPENLPDADLAILHVDLSVIPEPYLEALRRFPVVVNGTVADIRKRRYSTLLLSGPDDPWSGPVIVKSDLNSGGRPELLRWQDAQARGLDPGPPVPSFKGEYPVFNSSRGLPPWIWNHPGAVVERFLPERTAEGYCLRQCYCFGAAELYLKVVSRHRIVKGETSLRAEWSPAQEELAAQCRQMGFAYGKFDYVVHEGRAVLLDANRTPANALLAKFGMLAEATRKLAAGLDGLLGR